MVSTLALIFIRHYKHIAIRLHFITLPKHNS